MFGISFLPDEFYPFIRNPISEFKNQLLGANKIGFKLAPQICKQNNISTRKLERMYNKYVGINR